MQRYNLAHELGHMVVACADLSDRDQESLAHRFAAAFLVPRDVARRELGAKRRHIDPHELGLLKRKYGLSMQAWARRALDTGIIDAGYYKSLCVEFSRRGWRKREPYAFDGREEPTRLRQMTLRALAEGLITRDRAEQLCAGCLDQPAPAAAPPDPYLSAATLLKLPRKERERILAAAAAEAAPDYEAEAAPDYEAEAALTDFAAFGEGDLYDETP